jgi:hypothetical protein
MPVETSITYASEARLAELGLRRVENGNGVRVEEVEQVEVEENREEIAEEESGEQRTEEETGEQRTDEENREQRTEEDIRVERTEAEEEIREEVRDEDLDIDEDMDVDQDLDYAELDIQFGEYEIRGVDVRDRLEAFEEDMQELWDTATPEERVRIHGAMALLDMIIRDGYDEDLAPIHPWQASYIGSPEGFRYHLQAYGRWLEGENMPPQGPAYWLGRFRQQITGGEQWRLWLGDYRAVSRDELIGLIEQLPEIIEEE